MDPIITHDEPSHIWTKEEIIECGVCDAEEPDFERDEVNDIISVGAQDEYDADPDVLGDDANDFEDENNYPIIHEEKEEILEAPVELLIEPTVEPAVEPVQEPAVDIVLPFNIEKKEENEKTEEQEEKGEPDTNKVVGRLALDESIIEESAPKNVIVDENNLPFIDEEKEENPEKSEFSTEVTINTSVSLPVVEEPLNIVVPTIIDNELIERSAPPADNHHALTRRDNATFETPPAKKFKWKDWFQSLWFWA